MGCVNSHLLTHDDEIAQLSSAALSHHIVKLTSTTYGLLNLDNTPQPSPTTPPIPHGRFTLGSGRTFPSPVVEPTEPEVINSWELMDGLDTESFRFSPLPTKPISPKGIITDKENSDPNFVLWSNSSNTLKTFKENVLKPSVAKALIDRFDNLRPPSGEDRVVIYTTSLRGVRKTFEACNAVRAAIEGFGVMICERDVSMDRGFREELRELMKGKGNDALIPPRVFVRGRYIGGAEAVLRLVEDGCLGELLTGLPKKRAGDMCDGCGDARFLPCFRCSGSCKVVAEEFGRTVGVRCDECNENGLVVCPICS